MTAYNSGMAPPSHTNPDPTDPTVVSFGYDVLERMVLAVERVRDRLRRATSVLENAGIPYAIIGGNAVAAWVTRVDPDGARNTVDVDILISRKDLERARAAMEPAGFIYYETSGVHMFLDGPEGTPRGAVHLIFAGEKVWPHDVEPAPELSSTEPHESFHILPLEPLVRMKLNAFRRKDQVHLLDMIELGLIDPSWLDRLPPELAARLKTLLDNPEG
jgi:hypothetical protein